MIWPYNPNNNPYIVNLHFLEPLRNHFLVISYALLPIFGKSMFGQKIINKPTWEPWLLVASSGLVMALRPRNIIIWYSNIFEYCWFWKTFYLLFSLNTINFDYYNPDLGFKTLKRMIYILYNIYPGVDDCIFLKKWLFCEQNNDQLGIIQSEYHSVKWRLSTWNGL